MGSFTITTTAAQDARLVVAYGTYLGTVDGNGDPRNATGAEIKANIIASIKGIVLSQEKKALIEALEPDPFEPT
jgi:hypothetical protein